MKGLPLLTATIPISATVEDAAAIQVYYSVISRPLSQNIHQCLLKDRPW